MFWDQQNKLGYCHKTVMVKVAKPTIMANAVHQGLQGSYFLIRYLFFQNPIRCTLSVTVLTLSEMRSWWIAWNSKMRWDFFQAIGFLELLRAEMIIQAVWAWRPGVLQSVNITIFSRSVVTARWFEHSKHVIQDAEWTHWIHLWDSPKPSSLIHVWKVWLLDAYDWLLTDTDDAFEILITVKCCSSCTTELKEPLHSLLLAFAVSGWLTAIHFCLGLLQKYCFILGWLALRLCCDIIFWKCPHKKVNEQNLEKTWLAENVGHCRKD